MRPVALWLPFQVSDVEAGAAFYRDHLGLSIVDGWSRAGSRGLVLRMADAAFVELATPQADVPAPPPFAVELADSAEVDRVYATLRPGGSEPRRHPRGHYGFECDAPGGARVMVWSER